MRSRVNGRISVYGVALISTFVVPSSTRLVFAEQLFPVPAFVVGDAPVDCVSGEFNSDGRADLAVANASSSYISLLLGADIGVFSREVRIAVGEGPYSIASGDFNGDGWTDLVTANNISDDISVLLGRGDGSFVPETRLPAGDGPRSSVVADFNSDGRRDLAVANFFSADVWIYLGQGDGTFATFDTVSTGGFPSSVAAGDFNADGLPDLAVANSSDVSVYLGDGNGHFSPGARLVCAPQVGHSCHPTSVAIGDFNADGKRDLVSAEDDGINTFSGLGNGTFQGAVRWGAGVFRRVVVDDLDSDGRQDIMLGAVSGARSVLFGNGNGTFLVVPITAPEPPLAAGGAAVLDFNRDGLKDLAEAGGLFDDVLLFEAQGNRSFRHDVPPLYAVGVDVVDGLAGDFNEDGHQDIAVTDNASDSVAVLPGVGDGTLGTALSSPAGPGPSSLASADFNSDGHADLAVADTGNDTLAMLLGDGTGLFQQASALTVGVFPFAVQVGDFNNDLHADVVVTNRDSGDISILLGRGNGTFDHDRRMALDPSLPVEVQAEPLDVAVGDFNQDSYDDLALTMRCSCDEGSSVVVFIGVGGGTFSPPYHLSLASSGLHIRVGDLDSDGRDDLVVTRALGVSTFLGKGDGTFLPEYSFNLPASSPAIALGEFDADGFPDVATLDDSTTSRDVAVLLGSGDGTLLEQEWYSGNPGGGALVATDLNGDNRDDLVVISPEGPVVQINAAPAPDSDHDGMPDTSDPCTDTDRDGFGNPGFQSNVCATDNCPRIANTTQDDLDTDGSGDVCDNCPTAYNPTQTPSGLGDTLGAACEDQLLVAEVLPSHGGGFIRFKTTSEWNCPRFDVVRRDHGGEVVLASFPCLQCDNGLGRTSSFYGGAAGTLIPSIKGGNDIFVKAVRTAGQVCGGGAVPEPAAAVSPEIQAAKVR